MKTTPRFVTMLLILVLAWLLAGCASGSSIVAGPDMPAGTPTVLPPPYVTFTLKAVTNSGRLAYAGVGGELDGVINPDLVVKSGDTVRLVLRNADSMPHDLFIPDLDVKLPVLNKIGDQAEAIFKVGDVPPGTYVYYCTLPGHRKAGQEGKFIVQKAQP